VFRGLDKIWGGERFLGFWGLWDSPLQDSVGMSLGDAEAAWSVCIRDGNLTEPGQVLLGFSDFS
jgi:hypothetical protein